VRLGLIPAMTNWLVSPLKRLDSSYNHIEPLSDEAGAIG